MRAFTSVPGYAIAGLSLAILASMPVLLPHLIRAAEALPLAPDPIFAGSEVTRTLQRPGYQILIHRPVPALAAIPGTPAFLQLDWTPVAALPPVVEERLDLGGDGVFDTFIRFEVPRDPRALLTADLTCTSSRVASLKGIQRQALSTLVVRSGERIILRVPWLAGGGPRNAADRNLDPAVGHTWKALVHQQHKDPGAVIRECRLALAADPQDAEAYHLMGYANLENKQPELAVAAFRKQVELAPGDPDSYDSLGEGLLASGQVQAAIQAFRKGLELNPRFQACAAHLDTALGRAGRGKQGNVR